MANIAAFPAVARHTGSKRRCGSRSSAALQSRDFFPQEPQDDDQADELQHHTHLLSAHTDRLFRYIYVGPGAIPLGLKSQL